MISKPHHVPRNSYKQTNALVCIAVDVDIDDSALSLANQRDAARHHAEAAVMAAHQRRSAERRSSDAPRVLEVITGHCPPSSRAKLQMQPLDGN